jgi:hypothetical protein
MFRTPSPVVILARVAGVARTHFPTCSHGATGTDVPPHRPALRRSGCRSRCVGVGTTCPRPRAPLLGSGGPIRCVRFAMLGRDGVGRVGGVGETHQLVPDGSVVAWPCTVSCATSGRTWAFRDGARAIAVTVGAGGLRVWRIPSDRSRDRRSIGAVATATSPALSSVYTRAGPRRRHAGDDVPIPLHERVGKWVLATRARMTIGEDVHGRRDRRVRQSRGQPQHRARRERGPRDTREDDNRRGCARTT